MKIEKLKTGAVIIETSNNEIGVVTFIRANNSFDVSYDINPDNSKSFKEGDLKRFNVYDGIKSTFVESLSWWCGLNLDEQQTHLYHFCTGYEISTEEFSLENIINIYDRVHGIKEGDSVRYDNFGNDFQEGNCIYRVVSKGNSSYEICEKDSVNKPFRAYKYQLKKVS